ncbi:acetyl-CoA carboxylase biotin carboxyl carrier protein [Undibacterium sp. RTI2.1]|uniref:acetyl-CoA carboxylase biotin carboxyl carrier protein n=1 Tax=unclassified Undibacterium TaxID=2630295 RepID=UPI002AB38CC7|nr:MULTISPECIES: acetyl-CoA carboxylase biotin carboxyl carrier protein [unclassified Undibacterium]MDY7540463.1 acetyl-CoA carboxylase biotin carboxyl carrier protein [Undibacterium sp. 5I1]MEB0030654.1 acetyl-CoA carboxylase biotin carboxyl carrier protein [Undibacterium sp. RTI2.1]MEB0116595.1 acetyl-CoA carboxylase biotin carboxyl carrier protein [Undibacterium sp. RTI2.2]MEB0230076.1 acetyl-CoA carboxylase biotin carboxyl carrier protein [Undibacterium sp. 10I3]MEB0257722.1 acetyl-CoA car
MDLRKLKTLIDLVAESDIAELEVTEGEGKVRIVKSSAMPQNQVVMMQPQHMQQMPQQMAAAPVAASAPAAPVVPDGHVVKSPMVGTFYRSSAPGNAAFVEIGKSVKEGETLCIIEAMKLLNEIESDFTGTIKQILVENGQPVEYGQPLFIVG